MKQFHLGDFKGVYVATFSGTFHTSGVAFYGFIYLDADGSGGVTGSWEIMVPAGGTYGDSTPLQSTYTVTPQGQVRLLLRSTLASYILDVTVFLADRWILGFGGFDLGGSAGGGVGSVHGRKQ